MDTSQYKQLYVSEAQKHLATIEQGVLSVGSTPQDRKSLESIARAAHSLKGMSATMGYDQLAHFAGQVESLLDRAQQGTAPISAKLGNLLSDSLDGLRVLLKEAIEGRDGEVELTALVQRIEAYGGERSK